MSERDDIGGTGKGRALIAEYVLGLLDAPTHERLRREIADSPRLQAEEAFWRSRFGHLDAEFEAVEPPAGLLTKVEKRLFGAQARTSLWDSIALWRGVAAGALMVAAIAVSFSVLRPAPTSDVLATQLVAALQAEGSDVQFVAFYDGAGEVRLAALSGSAIPDRDYELWAIQAGQAPISMGLVPVDGRTTLALSDQVRAGWGEGSVLAITLEPKGGAPGGVATGPIVAQGTVTKI